jgi:hypothetical protein
MIDLEEIRSMVQQRRAPENSRILYGSAFWTFRNIWARVALPILILGLTGLNSSISVMGDVSPMTIHFLMAHFTAYTIIAALPIGCIITPLLAALWAKKAALVFLPDGWIEFDNVRSNNPARWHVFSYASISDIQLKLSFWRGPHLEARDHDGRKWRCDMVRYGPQGKTLQAMLAAYHTSAVSNKMPYLTLPYVPTHVE